MRKLNILLYLSFFLMLTGCLEDEGNYDYENIKAPRWYADPIKSSIRVFGKEGEVMKFRGHGTFKWETDSAQREKEVRYEWVVNDIVVGTQADFDILSDSIVKRIGLEEYLVGDQYLVGSFNIIDLETGARFMANAAYTINGARGNGDWFVLTEDGPNAKCYYIDRFVDEQTRKTMFKVKASYDETNGEVIPGEPLFLSYSRRSTNVGPLGSLTVITDQVAYELRPENFLKVGVLKDQFGGGTPDNFNPIARVDAGENESTVGTSTFVVTSDGRLFGRQMSQNNLGGAFITTPQYLDDKGYKITKFGRKNYGLNSFPCYDEKNNRVVVIVFDRKQAEGSMFWDPAYQMNKLMAVKYSSLVSGCPPAWEMPQGAKILDVGANGTEGGMGSPVILKFDMVYNLDGKTWYGEFGMDINSGVMIQAAAGWGPFPGVTLSKLKELPVKLADNTFILSTPSYTTQVIIYAHGNSVSYIDKAREYKNFSLISDFSEKVTFVGYAYENKIIVVGGINGKLSFYDITNKDLPQLLMTEQLSGKVVSAKELSTSSSGVEY